MRKKRKTLSFQNEEESDEDSSHNSEEEKIDQKNKQERGKF